MPVVVQTRRYDEGFYRAMQGSEAGRDGPGVTSADIWAR
jgi:hypothetical protein